MVLLFPGCLFGQTSVSCTSVGRRLYQITFPFESILTESDSPNHALATESSGGPPIVHIPIDTPTGTVRRAPSKSSMYATPAPPSLGIVLFFVFGSGSMYAASPLIRREEGSRVFRTGRASRARVRNGRFTVVAPSTPKMVLLFGSSPKRTLSLRVCWLRFIMVKPKVVDGETATSPRTPSSVFDASWKRSFCSNLIDRFAPGTRARSFLMTTWPTM